MSLCSQFLLNALTMRLSPLRKRAIALITSITPRSTMSYSTSAVEQARQLRMPTHAELLRRDPYAQNFWMQYHGLLETAWQEWSEGREGAKLPALDKSLYHPKLREAIEAAWKDPEKESAVRDLWKEVAPGVYQCEFFDPQKIELIRTYLDKASEAGIPARPPHGIVLNRKGFMIDPRSEGYLAIPDFQTFYCDLLDTYMRPLGRLFYPEYIQAEDDSQSFGFSIQYQPGKDQSIRQHSDSSSLTLNINLNKPDGEEFSGSSLYFVDTNTNTKHTVNFSPGVAVMHLGKTPHAALPITSGERSNLVLWLYGRNGRSSYYPYSPEEQMSREERWTKPREGSWESADKWSPF